MTLLDALKQMDKEEKKLLIVCEENYFLGVISIGDIQRALLKKKNLNIEVSSIMRNEIIVAKTSDDRNAIKQLMKEERIECMPVIDDNGRLIDTIEWKDIFTNDYVRTLNNNIPVVIMAGGKGTRLLPLTNVLPKPLIPISEKTIIEEIMCRFTKVGCTSFFISVNYMAEMIKEFFDRKKIPDISLEYIEETKPLGTAGSLYLLRDKLKDTFFVSNCDIIADVDLYEMLEYHKNNGNVITVLSVLKDYSIPYGTLETKEDGILIELKEKPRMVYQINSGVYILEPEVFEFMNDGEFIHITGLMERLIAAGKKIGVFPISDGSWFDMGNWEEYNKVIKQFS